MPGQISVRLQVKDQRILKELERIISSLDGFHLQDSDFPGRPDVLILEIGSGLGNELQLIHSLKTSNTMGEVFLTSASINPQILIEAKKAGAKVFFQPLKKEEIRNALLRLKESEHNRPSKEKKTQGEIIYLIGCKGGIGTTTVAVNLASNLAEMDKSQSVVLTDMTLRFGDLPVFLKIEDLPDWDEVARNVSRINPAYLNKILFKHSSGLLVLSSPSGMNGIQRLKPETVEKVLSVMQACNNFIVIDGGKSLGDISRKVLEISDAILVVIGLSEPCMVNVKRLLTVLYKLSYPHEKIKIIVNKNQRNSPISLTEAEERMNKEIFWKIPDDFPTTMAAINEGKVLSEVDNGKEICNCFRNLAAFFLNDGQPGKGKRSIVEKEQEENKYKNHWAQWKLKPVYKLSS